MRYQAFYSSLYYISFYILIIKIPSLRTFLDANGLSYVQLSFPPPALCTDNAAMIAWAGMEMFESGWTTDLMCDAIKTWSIDPAAHEGGILGVDGWKETME